MGSPVQLFQAGDLSGAIEAATHQVRGKPTDVAARGILAELLCFAGELERADKQLDAMLKLSPSAIYGITLLRQLIRAETFRAEVFEQGRVPEFMQAPSESDQLRLQSLVARRAGDWDQVACLLNAAAELTSSGKSLKGELNGNQFEDFCDLDDLFGPTLEVYTATGKYYWLSCEQIVSLEFDVVTSLTDMLWRSATIETRGEVTGRIHIPAIYYGSAKSADALIKIGRATDWIQPDPSGPICGIGQREFLAGDKSVSIMEFQSLRFDKD